MREYSELWIADKAETISESTKNRYKSALVKRILPKLGHIRMSRLSRRDIIRWRNWASTAERERIGDDEKPCYSTATVRGWWSVLCTLVRDAEADGLLDEDPSRRVKSPKTERRKTREQRTLSSSQLYDLVVAARERYPSRYAEIAFLAYTGVRAGEAYALKWENVDLVQCRADIRWSVWRGEHVGRTKTDSYREVPLPEIVVDALDYQHTRLMKGDNPGFSEKGLVFPSTEGSYRIPQSLQNNLETLTGEDWLDIDIHVTPQVLRRSYNTILRKKEVDGLVLREVMGHSGERMTELYSEVDFPEKKEAVSRVFDDPKTTGGGAGN